MPLTMAFLDDLRAHLGDPVRIDASEAEFDLYWVHPRLRAAEAARRVPVFVQAAPPSTVMPPALAAVALRGRR